MSLQPFHSDRTLLNVSSAAALISTVVAALDPKGLLLGKHHYLLYSIVPAIQVAFNFEKGLSLCLATTFGLPGRRQQANASLCASRSSC